MTDKLTPVRCGCGGEAHHDSASCWNPEEEEWMPNFWHRVICKNCGTQTKAFYTEAEAIEAWNRAMGNGDKASPVERTAKVMKHHYDFDPRKDSFYHGLGGTELLCGNCKKMVLHGDEYCSHCGARLDWSE